MKRLITTCLVMVMFNVSISIAGNVAINKPVWSNAPSNWVSDGNPATNAVDGDLTTNWNTGVVATINNPLILTVDLESTYLVNSINLYADCLPETGRYISYILLSSLDQSDWTAFNSGNLVSIDEPWPKQIDFDPISMRYLRYEVVGGTIWAHLYEMQVYETPEPATLLLLGLGGLILRRKH